MFWLSYPLNKIVFPCGCYILCCKLLDYCLLTDGMEMIELLTIKQLAYMVLQW